MTSVMNRFHEKGFIALVYIDDLIIMGRTSSEAVEAKQLFQSLIEARGLTLHPDKSQNLPVHNRKLQNLLGLGLNYLRIEAESDAATGKEKAQHRTLVLKGARKQWRRDGLQLLEAWNKDKKGYGDDTLRLRAEALENIAAVIELGADDPLRKELRAIVALSAPRRTEPNITGPVHSKVSPVSSNRDRSTIGIVTTIGDSITKPMSARANRGKNPSTAHAGSRSLAHPLFPKKMRFPIESIISRRLNPEQSQMAYECYEECIQTLCNKSLDFDEKRNEVIRIINGYYFLSNSTIFHEDLKFLLPDVYQNSQNFSRELRLRGPSHKKIGEKLLQGLNRLHGTGSKIIIDAKIKFWKGAYRLSAEPNIRTRPHLGDERILIVFRRSRFPMQTLSLN
jgi:hypothetical protein